MATTTIHGVTVRCYWCQRGKGIAQFTVDEDGTKHLDTTQPIQCDTCHGDFLPMPVTRLTGECPSCRRQDAREVQIGATPRTLEKVKHRPCPHCGTLMVRTVVVQIEPAPYRPAEPFGRRAFYGRL